MNDEMKTKLNAFYVNAKSALDSNDITLEAYNHLLANRPVLEQLDADELSPLEAMLTKIGNAKVDLTHATQTAEQARENYKSAQSKLTDLEVKVAIMKVIKPFAQTAKEEALVAPTYATDADGRVLRIEDALPLAYAEHAVNHNGITRAYEIGAKVGANTAAAKAEETLTNMANALKNKEDDYAALDSKHTNLEKAYTPLSGKLKKAKRWAVGLGIAALAAIGPCSYLNFRTTPLTENGKAVVMSYTVPGTTKVIDYQYKPLLKGFTDSFNIADLVKEEKPAVVDSKSNTKPAGKKSSGKKTGNDQPKAKKKAETPKVEAKVEEPAAEESGDGWSNVDIETKKSEQQ